MTGNLYVYVLQDHYTTETEYVRDHKNSHSHFYYALSKGIIPEFKIYGIDIWDLDELVEQIHGKIKYILGLAKPYEECDELEEHWTYTFCYRFVSLKENYEEAKYRQFVKSYTKESNYVLK